ncbi:hypothetical protein ACLB0R_03565 [Sphingomonas sp. GlSt437]|uniref:hypothetical protein n=2 Tax=Sphingomonas sp. GlSt437 TaxID=3389970 RepID=UPI003EBBF12C
MNLMKKAGLAVALGATALASAAPASAQYRGWHGGYRHYDNGGAVVAAGIAGLAIGAVIASDHDRYRDRYYYDHGYPADYDVIYYRDHGYYPRDGYYAYRYRPRYEHCWVEHRWDRYWDRPVDIEVCR